MKKIYSAVRLFILFSAIVTIMSCVFIGFENEKHNSITLTVRAVQTIALKKIEFKVKQYSRWKDIKPIIREQVINNTDYPLIWTLNTIDGDELDDDTILSRDCVIWINIRR